MTTLIVIRHGEAEGNREHRFLGQSDPPLSDNGRRQVEALTERLARRTIHRVVTSDLRRAADTARPLAERLGVPLAVEPRFREVANGEWTGLLAEEVAAGWPELWSAYREGRDITRPGGESWADVRRRAVAAARELLEGGSDGEVIALATHAGPALSIIQWAAGLADTSNVFHSPLGRLDNASISVIVHPGPSVVVVNDTGHLDTMIGR